MPLLLSAQIVQLTALRPTADLFCAYLRDGLKTQLQQGQMRAMKVFVKTCYSEGLLAAAGESVDEKALPVGDESAGALSKDDAEPTYHGGLGLRFKFPGDPKKCAMFRASWVSSLLKVSSRLREASKIKLWTTYLKGSLQIYD